jgi:hypothetical protein
MLLLSSSPYHVSSSLKAAFAVLENVGASSSESIFKFPCTSLCHVNMSSRTCFFSVLEYSLTHWAALASANSQIL